MFEESLQSVVLNYVCSEGGLSAPSVSIRQADGQLINSDVALFHVQSNRLWL